MRLMRYVVILMHICALMLINAIRSRVNEQL